MNSYGNMKESLRRTAAYQQVGCEFMPGYGSDAFRITVQDGAKRVSDVFHIYNDGDLNAAINKLYGRL
jgi:hypothetical protein